MTDFQKMLNWKLLKGSHKFPGPDGGTCINEAAIIAAGFEYKEVESAADCPPCFSRPIAQFAIGLNDAMPNSLRQTLLLPFVVRLAGTADSKEVERRRADHMLVQVTRRILSVALETYGIKTVASQCREAESVEDVFVISRSPCGVAGLGLMYEACREKSPMYVASKVSSVVAHNAYLFEGHLGDAMWEVSVDILDEAIALGKQPAPIDTATIVQRMEKARVVA